MPDTVDTIERRKIVGLISKLRELQAQIFEIVEEVDTLLGGGVSIGQQMKQLEHYWICTWSSRYQGDYVFNWKRDKALEKKLLKVFSPEQLFERMQIYVKNDDPFFLKNRHSFGLFVSTINQHAPAPTQYFSGLEDYQPMGCTHDPPCKDDSEHTRRRMADLRA